MIKKSKHNYRPVVTLKNIAIVYEGVKFKQIGRFMEKKNFFFFQNCNVALEKAIACINILLH